MKRETKMLTAVFLNLAFSIFEFVGGLVTGSVAIVSDAVHDMGDAAGLGIAWALEKKSRRQPDEIYTYGGARYTVLGGALTTMLLLVSSGIVIVNAVRRLLAPAPIHYEGMILFAVIGLAVNGGAAFITRGGENMNQRAVSLHMLEDVLGWAVVLAGAVVMRFTDWAALDPLMSIAVAVFIAISALRVLKQSADVFLEKAPRSMDGARLREELLALEGVRDVHHIHLWSLDGQRNCATMHLVAEGDPAAAKERARARLKELGLGHACLELESVGEVCGEECCAMEGAHEGHGHHHHHH